MPKFNAYPSTAQLNNTDIMLADTQQATNTRKIAYSDLRTQLQNESKSVFALHGEVASDEQVADAVGDWLDEHTTATMPTVLVDDTLSIEDAAAEAKATGEMIIVNGTSTNGTRINITTTEEDVVLAEQSDVDELENALNTVTDTTVIEFIPGKYISTSGSTANINAPSSSANYRYAVIECVAGDVFTVNATGGSNPRAWAFVSNDGTVLSRSVQNAVVTDTIITADSGSRYLIINDNNSGGVSYKGIGNKVIKERITDLEDDMEDAIRADDISVKPFLSDGYLNINLTDGTRSIIYSEEWGVRFNYTATIGTQTNVNPSVRIASSPFSEDPSVEPYLFYVDFTKHPYLFVRRNISMPGNEDYGDNFRIYAYNATTSKLITITPELIPENGMVDLYWPLYNQTGVGNNIGSYTSLAIYGVYANTVATSPGTITLSYDVYGIVYQNDIAKGVTFAESITALSEKCDTSKKLARDSYLYRSIIPSYYFDKTENPQDYHANEYIDGKIASIPEGKHFVFVTDTHWDPIAASGRCTSSHQSTKLIQYIRKRANIKTVVFGGDILNRANTKYIANMWLKAYMNDVISAFGTDLVYCHGNHDMNTANIDTIEGYTMDEAYDQFMIPYEEVFRSCFEPFNGSINYDTNYYNFSSINNASDLREMMYYNKYHFYVDDDENKIRYISLYTGTKSNGIVQTYTNTYAYGETLLQAPWLYKVLQTVPEGYDIVCVGHQMISPTTHQAISDSVRIPIKLLCARRAKKSFSYNFPARGVYYGAGTQLFDFAGLPDVGKVILVTGHYHVDDAVLFTMDNNGNMTESSPIGSNIGDGVLGIMTQCDAFGQTVSGSATMTENTISETCIDVVTYNDNGVYLTRIGAGEDREFQY